MKKLIFILFLITILNFTMADEMGHDDALELRQAGEILSLEQVLGQARQQHTGTVLEVELEKENGIIVYEIEILDQNGVIWEMKFDAKDGSLLSDEKD